jgi:tetratricopeptide (TPR) repeat protein
VSGPDEGLAHASSRFDRLNALLAAGQIERARKLALDGVGQSPDDPDAHKALAFVLSLADRVDDALSSMATALRLAPDDPGAHLLHGRILQQAGRWAEAERALHRALELDPASSDACAALGHLLWILDRDRDGLAWVERALALEPNDAELHALRAKVLLTVPASAWSTSEEAARTALAIDPESADAEAVLGTVLLGERRHDEAEAHLRSALMREPSHPLALRALTELTMAESLMFRPLLAMSSRLSRLSDTGRLGFAIGLWVLYRGASATLRLAELDAAAELLFAAYLGFCAWTWFAAPITRWILARRHPWLLEV